MRIAYFSVSPSPSVLSALKNSPRFLPLNLRQDGIRNTAQNGALEMRSRPSYRHALV